MKFKNLTIATCAIFALTACNNSIDDVIDRENGNSDEPKQLVVSIQLPEAYNSSTKRLASRGIIGSIDEKIPPIVLTNGTAYIKNKEGVTEERIHFNRESDSKNKLSGEGNKFQVTLKSKKVKEGESIFMTFNNESTSFKEIGIKDIQPDANKYNAEKAIYTGAGNVTKKANSRINSANEYLASITATSIVSRVQLFGNVKFDPKVCQSVELAYASPINYTKSYFGYTNNDDKPQIGDIVARANSIDNLLGFGAVYSRINNGLLELFTSTNKPFNMSELSAVNTGNKAITNHVFELNEAKYYIGLYLKSYLLKRNNEYEIINIAPKVSAEELANGAKQEEWYLYYKSAAKDERELYTRKKDDKGVFKNYKVTYDATNKKYVVANNPENVELYTEARVRYYTLKGFGTKKDQVHLVERDASGNIKVVPANGVLCYDGGKIYKINLNTVPWKGENGIYTPETDPGREDVDENDEVSTLEVIVTIEDWAFSEMKDLEVSDNI